ncbi:MAG: tRNA (adenosine(37)-N6)-threonylcarbamoyltransferase complex ATPase subunit type 1 TsaE, partial [Firmicutes bacterium]|nr:tRNA (adenosine(37)-N6)-threonylcarbamoyltransferase complex ATPase subunit type 1 TsaE [Bacillota bacterium]
MAVYHSKSESETEAIGAEFARALPGGSVVAMYGELGAGKTAFVRGM